LLNAALRLLLTPMRSKPLRRSVLIALTALAAAATNGCHSNSEGVVEVVVVGDQPRLADPQRGPLTPGDGVLVNNVAQGLVRFDAHGQIEPGLAEAWNVSDDGLSYIFRLANGTWPNGRKITADQVARMLRRMIVTSSRDPLRDSFGAVDDVVAMTDRVIEISLKQPRPHLLQLLAQPEMGLVYEDGGTGPFSIDRKKSQSGVLRLAREVAIPDEEQTQLEQLNLSGAKVQQAVSAFAAGKADLVLGGTFADLPGVVRSSLPRRTLQFDPASGLFGLVPMRADGLIANPQVRQMLSEALDRDSLVGAFEVPGLVPRTTVLEPGLDDVPDPVPPSWTATAIVDRRTTLVATARRLLPANEPAEIRVALPDGPGADIIFDHLSRDWGVLGIKVERAAAGEAADFRLVDEVSPSSSPAWFVRHFRCAAAPLCDSQVDEMLDSARNTPVLAQRNALLFQAAQRIDSLQLYIPIAAPIRWSLVSARISGFAGNRFAIHTLTGLEQRLNRTGD
jgi:peptide/nickel transport system substrate-binding protein